MAYHRVKRINHLYKQAYRAPKQSEWWSNNPITSNSSANVSSRTHFLLICQFRKYHALQYGKPAFPSSKEMIRSQKPALLLLISVVPAKQ